MPQTIPATFSALLITAFGEHAQFRQVNTAELPEGDILVKVAYSSLNYKDGLAVTSRGKVLRAFPAVPGIDLAGTIAESSAPEFPVGSDILVTGCGLGETTWGGYSQYARARSEWIVPLPNGLSLQRAMAIGTAGFTAMLAVMALERSGIAPDSGDVLVTGAAGGVGSVAVTLLRALGYRVVASTGRADQADYLKALGAAETMDRSTLATPGKPLEKQRWAACIDSVGGTTLAHALAEMKYGGAVAACGLAGGAELATTVMPFILRAVALVGINSVETPMPLRRAAWRRLVETMPMDKLDAMTSVARFEDVPRLSEEILVGRVRGRTVIAVGA